MKKHLFGFLLGISVTVLLAFQVVNFEPNASTAEVNKIDGFYIFTDSKPIMPYDSIGSVEIGFMTETQYESVRDNLIKRAKSKFPNAEGLLLHFDKKGIDQSTVIRFK